jgi:coproporphyrinogen III oxidase-like Fe-S oxidoreductase
MAACSLFDQPEPEAGNYFVSTYPPFSCWTPGAETAFRQWLDQPPAGDPPALGLYVHIPFCAERCHYCYYLSHDDRFADADAYLEALVGEFAAYGRTPALAGRPLEFVYVGGGTPSVLSTPRVRSLVDGLQRVAPWRHAREVTFECAPRSVTDDKAHVLRDAGVTRISLGVQQMDDRVLAANGRIHLVADVERACERIRRAGFDVVNLDLMTGLVGETDASFFESLEQTLALGPESVTIYQLEIPHNTPLYRAMRAGGQHALPAPWSVKRARLGAAMSRLETAGYTVRSAYSAVLDCARHRFVYQDEQYRGADLLGVGVSAFSCLGGINQQNLASLDAYLAARRRGDLPTWRAYALSPTERMVREFVLQLKLGGVDRATFGAKFGVDAVQAFAEPLAEASRRGWAAIDDDRVLVTRAGLLRIDRLLPAFYLPEHRDVRYS